MTNGRAVSVNIFSVAFFRGPAMSLSVTVRTALALIVTNALTKLFPTEGTTEVQPVRTLETS